MCLCVCEVWVCVPRVNGHSQEEGKFVTDLGVYAWWGDSGRGADVVRAEEGADLSPPG